MKKVFLRGLLGLAPIAITIGLVVWLYETLEYIFGAPVRYFFPHYYFPGAGIIIAIIILFIIGLVLNNWVAQVFYNWIENQLKKIPLLKTIYTSITDLMSFFHTGDQKANGKIVMFEYQGMRIMGIVCREAFDDLPEGVGKEGEIAVFLPFSYQIGGLTIIVPKESVKPIDYTLEKGLRFIITAANPSADRATFMPKRPLRPNARKKKEEKTEQKPPENNANS